MRLTLNARLIGLAAGALAGLLFVLLGWRGFLVLLAFTLFGLLVGLWLDAQPGVARRLREVFARLFSS
jgi:hypothetical protein